MKLPLKQQHKHCPKSPNTWCKFWKDKQDKTKLYNEDNRLPEVFMKELQPIFTRLSNDGLLNRCLQGMTQNQNEAANGMLWAPKLDSAVQGVSGLLCVKQLLFLILEVAEKQWL